MERATGERTLSHLCNALDITGGMLEAEGRSCLFSCVHKPFRQYIIISHFELLYRSPWSNEYDPPLEDGTVPTPKLRKLEITANEAFDTYREL